MALFLIYIPNYISPSSFHPLATNPCPCKSAHISLNYYYTRFQCFTTNTFQWLFGRHFSVVLMLAFSPLVLLISPSSLQESLTPTCCRRLQVSFDPCFARCKHGTCSVVLWSILLGGSFLFFPHWGFFSFQSAGISLLLAEEGCRLPSIHVFARCKHGTCSDEVWWSLWMVGRSRQLDKGAGRQKWKCHDPLNCVASAAPCVALHIV